MKQTQTQYSDVFRERLLEECRETGLCSIVKRTVKRNSHAVSFFVYVDVGTDEDDTESNSEPKTELYFGLPIV